MPKELQDVGHRIPFLLISLTVFLRGSLVLIFLAPALYYLFQDKTFNSPTDFVQEVMLNSWANVLSTQLTITFVFMFVFLSLIIGFATAPIANAFSTVIAILLEFPKTLSKQDREPTLFSPLMYIQRDYIDLVEWFSHNQDSLTQWEWQQFFYHLYWAYFMVIALFVLSLRLMVKSNYSMVSMVLLASLIAISLIGAILHSRHMGKVHRNSLRIMREEGNKKNGPSINTE